MPNSSEEDSQSRAQGDKDGYQRLLEATFEHAVFMLGPEGGISMWPAVAQRLYGYEDSVISGRHLDTLFADAEDTPASVEDLLEEAKAELIKTEGWHERADGSVFWASCMISPLPNDGFDGYAVVSQDTTSRKQYERMLERQNDRLKEFTDILSHDLRSPLAVIDGRLALYRETREEEHLSAIELTTERMAQLVEDLLRVARQGRVIEDPKPNDISVVLETAREGTLPESATFDYDSIPTVMAAPGRLVQLFENLLRNSVDHGGEHVTVRVGPLQDGFYVEDDGPGIPEAALERVFEHGYTTHEDGTGYGLSIVRSIVGAHGWDITVTETEGGGARFEITGIKLVSKP